MTDEQIQRINALARKAREEGLNDAEREEQLGLRRAYIDAVKKSLKGHLDHISPQGPEVP